MKLRQMVLSLAILLMAASLAGCGATVTPPATLPPTVYDDPFAYCAAVGTVDTPDANYTGPRVPQSVAEGLQRALNAPDTPLSILENGSSWRCMDGEVHACFVGANLPCEAKANTDRTATQEESEFCQQNPNSDFIPAAVTGRETVFEWRCRDGAPEIVQQVFHPDAQGFLSEIWYKIGPTEAGAKPTAEPTAAQIPNPAPTTTAGSTIQPLATEVCNGQAQAMSHTLDDLVPTQSEEPLDDPVTDARGTGCQATVTGTGVQFETPAAVVNALGNMLEDQGWTADPMLVADGPTGTAAGYRKGNQICWAAALWDPDESANCPADQPISACEVTPEQQNYTVTLNCGVATAEGQTSANEGSEQLVFDSTRGGAYRHLYVMNSNGHDLSELTQGEADSFAGPWSPDGTRIVYTTFGLTTSDIAVINTAPLALPGDGSPVNLTNTPDIDEGFPAWSPDGKQIAFTSRRDGNNEIYLMDANGANLIRLTDSPGDDFAPAWSPDGTQIVFVSDRDREAGIYDLYVMNADGSDVRRLTDDEAIDYSPAWSPDGMHIAFRSHHNGPADIYVISLDGSELRNLTNSAAEEWAPTWSPDGTRLAFQTNRDGNWEIYVMNADGTEAKNLTQDPADDQLPFWRP